MTVIPITRKMDRKTEQLLADHQAIIDAWYKEWLEDQQERIDELFARKGSSPVGQTR
jgi:hypothetical protein